MICDKCGIEMRVTGTPRPAVPVQEGEVLKIYHVADMACRNAQCEAFEKAVEVKTLLYPQPEGEEEAAQT